MLHLFAAAQDLVEGMLCIRSHGACDTLLAKQRTGTCKFGDLGARATFRWDLDCLIGSVVLQKSGDAWRCDWSRILPPLEYLDARIGIGTAGSDGRSRALGLSCRSTQARAVPLGHGDRLFDGQRLGT